MNLRAATSKHDNESNSNYIYVPIPRPTTSRPAMSISKLKENPRRREPRAKRSEARPVAMLEGEEIRI